MQKGIGTTAPQYSVHCTTYTGPMDEEDFFAVKFWFLVTVYIHTFATHQLARDNVDFNLKWTWCGFMENFWKMPVVVLCWIWKGPIHFGIKELKNIDFVKFQPSLTMTPVPNTMTMMSISFIFDFEDVKTLRKTLKKESKVLKLVSASHLFFDFTY